MVLLRPRPEVHPSRASAAVGSFEVAHCVRFAASCFTGKQLGTSTAARSESRSQNRLEALHRFSPQSEVAHALDAADFLLRLTEPGIDEELVEEACCPAWRCRGVSYAYVHTVDDGPHWHAHVQQVPCHAVCRAKYLPKFFDGNYLRPQLGAEQRCM